MPKIISIQNHIELEKAKKLEEDRKRQAEAVQKIVLCSLCPTRCSRCGTEVAARRGCPLFSAHSLNLCPSCAEDYSLYMASLAGVETDDISWHNHEWKELWRTWLDYQQALKNYQQSREVRELFQKE